MVIVMPIRDSIFRRLRTPRVRVLAASSIMLLSLAVRAEAAIQQAASDDWFSTIFSTYSITVIFVLMFVGLLVFKLMKSRKPDLMSAPSRKLQGNEMYDRRRPSPAPAPVSELPAGKERRAPVIEGAQVWEKPAQVDQSAFGAYRIDQEVSKLALGRAHRTDVLSSRALEDRRSIEGSLIKALESSDTSEEGRERIRQALEEYGFVARQSATMLLGRDPWERSSAARVLGQIRVKSSLPFLLEALHDGDSVVRNQAVTSLGSLKAPAAIGALLDIARRHPDIPASLLSETLSACSVDSLSYLDAPSTELSGTSGAEESGDARDLDTLGTFQALPSGAGDEDLRQALAELESADEHVRAVAAQQLGLHPVNESVTALTNTVVNDAEASVRAAAVASLGSIDHESVFAAVLIGLADESRIVRAAAARTMTGLHFDRADAYVRIMETAAPDMLKRVAHACVQTGVFAQAVDRLASEDRHQAYEAFSLFSLLARARESEPILDAIRKHKDEEVRLAAVRVLNLEPNTSLAPKLREIVSSDGVPESVRTAVLELLYKLDQDNSPTEVDSGAREFDPSDIQPVTLHNSP
jgi:HEAT repeat protein